MPCSAAQGGNLPCSPVFTCNKFLCVVQEGILTACGMQDAGSGMDRPPTDSHGIVAYWLNGGLMTDGIVTRDAGTVTLGEVFAQDGMVLVVDTCTVLELVSCIAEVDDVIGGRVERLWLMHGALETDVDAADGVL